MPIVELHVLQGYDNETKKRLGIALTDAIRFVVPAPADAITVMVREMAPDDYFRGGVTRAPAPPNPDPAEIVRDFLAAMERRDLDAARRMLGAEFTMYFPATPPMTRLEQLIEWAGPRYRFVRKTYEGFDAMQGPEDTAVVYCRGTLSGEWPDGTPFADIRFIDRFEISGTKIVRQDVWNDIAETRMNA